MARRCRVHEVDRSGITLSVTGEAALDVLFDGRRVWSVRVPRDTTRVGPRRRHAAWPASMERYLDGRTLLAVRDSVTHEVLHEEEVSIGSSAERIRLVNLDGIELGVDKSGALVPTFETRPPEDIAALVRATGEVLSTLETAGARPFVAYGTLLGAVREGAVIGHDSDADVAYVSDAATPVDVIRESFQLQRQVGRLGLPTVRYSGAAFKVQVPEADGVERGLDVFGGFFDDGRLYLMGEVGAAFERDWLYPLGTASLEGTTVPVPARPEKLLEAMYGPQWRVPDPVFRFSTPERTKRALDDWFRGLRPAFRYWYRRFSTRQVKLPKRSGLELAQRAAADALATSATVLDVGAGGGPDSLWLARQGVPVVAYDFVTLALDVMAAEVAGQGLDLDVRHLNLADSRSVLGEATRLAHTPGRRIVLCRHVIDAVGERSIENFARFCSMALREGGTLYLETYADATPKDFEWSLGRVDVPALVRLLEQQGAHSLEIERIPRDGETPRTVRLVAQWGS